jgi:hypothetical protein
MRQIRPGVYVDDPLPAHTTRVANDWLMTLQLGRDMPLPTAVIVNGVRYDRKKD